MTENRGGSRPGAGRKIIFDLGDKEGAKIVKQVDEQAKKNGTDIGSELGKLMFAPNADKRLKMQAMQLYVRDVLPKVSERNVTVNEIRMPQVFIPEELPDTNEAKPYEPRRDD